MSTGTKCDICGLRISISSKLLHASKYEELLSTVSSLRESGQIPAEIKLMKNSDLGLTSEYCSINDSAFGLPLKCKHWQLDLGQNTIEHLAIHQSKTNLYVAKVALTVAWFSLVVAVIGVWYQANDANTPRPQAKEVRYQAPSMITTSAEPKAKDAQAAKRIEEKAKSK